MAALLAPRVISAKGQQGGGVGGQNNGEANNTQRCFPTRLDRPAGLQFVSVLLHNTRCGAVTRMRDEVLRCLITPLFPQASPGPWPLRIPSARGYWARYALATRRIPPPWENTPEEYAVGIRLCLNTTKHVSFRQRWAANRRASSNYMSLKHASVRLYLAELRCLLKRWMSCVGILKTAFFTNNW